MILISWQIILFISLFFFLTVPKLWQLEPSNLNRPSGVAVINVDCHNGFPGIYFQQGDCYYFISIFLNRYCYCLMGMHTIPKLECRMFLFFNKFLFSAVKKYTIGQRGCFKSMIFSRKTKNCGTLLNNSRRLIYLLITGKFGEGEP